MKFATVDMESTKCFVECLDDTGHTTETPTLAETSKETAETIKYPQMKSNNCRKITRILKKGDQGPAAGKVTMNS